MRRTARIYFHVTTALSALLGLALLIVFCTVDFSGDQPEWWTWRSADGRSASLMLAKDKIEWERRVPVGPGLVTSRAQWGPLGRFVRRNAWVLEFSNGSYGEPISGGVQTVTAYQFTLKTGPLFLLALVLPCWWAVWRWRTAGARDAGLCPDCGYDCRATPGRCPECGWESGNPPRMDSELRG